MMDHAFIQFKSCKLLLLRKKGFFSIIAAGQHITDGHVPLTGPQHFYKAQGTKSLMPRAVLLLFFYRTGNTTSKIEYLEKIAVFLQFN